MQKIYCTIYRHEALSPQPIDASTTAKQHDNEVAWTQLLVARVLPLVLPPEDLLNPCLHVLVSEIFSEMIVHRVICQRVSEAWLIWEGITKAVRTLTLPTAGTQQPANNDVSSKANRLEQFGLLSSKEAANGHQQPQQMRRSPFDAIVQFISTALRICALSWSLLQSLVAALMQANSIPTRSSQGQQTATSVKLPVSAVDPPEDRPDGYPQMLRPGYVKQPIIKLTIWTCISRLSALDQRMPWLSGMLSLLQWLLLRGPGRVGDTDGILDR